MELKTFIGRRMRLARLKSGLTQEALADRIERSTRAISSVESGHTLASLPILELTATQLHVPLSYFFEGYDCGKQPAKLSPEFEIVAASLKSEDLSLSLAFMKLLLERAG